MYIHTWSKVNYTKGWAENPSSLRPPLRLLLFTFTSTPHCKREKLESDTWPLNPTLPYPTRSTRGSAFQVAVREIQVAVSAWKTTLHRQYGTQIPLHVVASGWRGQTSSRRASSRNIVAEEIFLDLASNGMDKMEENSRKKRIYRRLSGPL